MREIKFRNWDKENKRMVYLGFNFYQRGPMKDELEFDSEKDYNRDWENDKEGILSEPELMQYTGLKDKNGKEIYEGDIVKFETTLGIVEWTNGDCAEFFIRGKRWVFYEMSGKLFCWDELEVIGNIYENEELLK